MPLQWTIHRLRREMRRLITFHRKNDPEFAHMPTFSSIMVDAAARRQESRGVHFPKDFPNVDDEHWLQHVCFRQSETYLSPA